MNHSSNESLSKLEFKNDFISDFAKNKLVEVVRVTNGVVVGGGQNFLVDFLGFRAILSRNFFLKIFWPKFF